MNASLVVMLEELIAILNLHYYGCVLLVLVLALIQDGLDNCASKETMGKGKDSSVPLMHHDSSDPGPMIRFEIFPKKTHPYMLLNNPTRRLASFGSTTAVFEVHFTYPRFPAFCFIHTLKVIPVPT